MLEGTLGEFSLPDIFQLIALTKKSGTLSVRLQTVGGGDAPHAGEGRVVFRDGEVSYAVADTRRIALGARLVAAGLVSEEQLLRVLKAHRRNGAGIAQALLEDSILDEAALDAFIRSQITDAVFDLMRVGEASFNFNAEDHGAVEGITLSTEELVTEGLRRLEEWTSIRERVPSDEVALAIAPEGSAGGSVTLSAEQWRLLALIDGRRSVRELVELTGEGEFATAKVLAGMVSAGVLEVSGEGAARNELLSRGERLRQLEEMELGAGDGSGDGSAVPAQEPESPPAEGEPEEHEATETPEAPEPPAAAEASEAQKPHATANAAPALPPAPQPSSADRSQVARELASLGSDAQAAQGGSRINGNRGRLTRDQDVDSELVGRLIDGVKGT